VTDPVTEGLEPEARAGLRPAQRGPAATKAHIRDRGRVAAGILIAWLLILGIIVGLGELITKDGNGNVLGDLTIPRWFAAHRAPASSRWSLIVTTLGRDPGDPHRGYRYVRRLPRGDPALAASSLHSHPHVRWPPQTPHRQCRAAGHGPFRPSSWGC
jgi:hypothetical protein